MSDQPYVVPADIAAIRAAHLAKYKKLALSGDAGELRFALEEIHHGSTGFVPGSHALLRAMFVRLAVLLDRDMWDLRREIIEGPNPDDA